MTTEKTKKQPTCRNWQILLGEYVLGTIAERDRTRLEGHLARCRRCRRALAETEKMYRLMDEFELAQAGPFFAAKVERAIKGEVGEPKAEPSRARTRAGRWSWLRAPAFITAAAAAASALVIGVLYVKVWLPGAAGEAEGPPAAMSPPLSLEAGGKRTESVDVEARGVTERRTEVPVPAPKTGERIAAVPPAPEEFTTYDAASAATPFEGKRPETALYLAELKKKTRSAEEEVADFDELMRSESAAGSGVVYGGAGRGYGRAGAMAPSFAAPPGAVTLTASDVEGWMDPRFEADVERLTGDEGALLDYVTPNGSLMAYFYELPVEEQRTLLSRMRREAEEKSAAEIMLHSR